MKRRTRGASLLCAALVVAVPLAASAQSNAPGGGTRAALPGTLTVTGTQTIAEVGDCSEVETTITGDVTGTVDDGGGFDTVRFELWDDGTMEDSEVLQIPVGTTVSVDVTLSFLGLYLTGAPGVGVLLTDQPGGGVLFVADPFFPIDVFGTCPTCDTPVAGCLAAGKSSLLLKNEADDAKDRLVWKWLKGAETSLASLGDPTATTTYTLCVYSGGDATEIELPAGASWQAAGTKGFRFKDPSGVPDGAQKALLKSGAAGKAKALVKAKGANLPDELAPALTLPVTVQLVNDANDTCFEATYTTATKNTPKKFLGKAP